MGVPVVSSNISDEEEKRLKGQFFTITNPFATNIFFQWFKSIPDYENVRILEPFAGGNNIVNMIDEIGFHNQWDCYDIAPPRRTPHPSFL